MSVLLELLDRLDGPSPPDLVDELRWSLQTFVRAFDGLAVVRDGRVRIVYQVDLRAVRLLVADTATAGDREALLAGMRRGDQDLITASALLGHALGLPISAPARLAALVARVARRRRR